MVCITINIDIPNCQSVTLTKALKYVLYSTISSSSNEMNNIMNE